MNATVSDRSLSNVASAFIIKRFKAKRRTLVKNYYQGANSVLQIKV